MARAAESFPTTSWSLVVAAGDGASADSTDALARLCAAYWGPLYTYVRRSGHDAEESRDLTQEFFARLIEKHYLRTADQQRGRFRTYLLAALKHFLANEWDRARAAKRGSGAIPLPLDLETAESRYGGEAVDLITPEKVYERRWALTVLGRAMEHLRGEFAAGGKAQMFQALQPFLTGDDHRGDYAQACPELGMSTGALKVAVHRARRRYAALVRDEVAATMDRPEDIDDELHHLFSVL